MADETVRSEVYLFDPNEPIDWTDHVGSFLTSLAKHGAIKYHIVDSVHEATWEERFPVMPVRLLAIEAVERFGAKLPDPLPEYARGYPYTQVEHVWFTDPETGRVEYIGNSICGLDVNMNDPDLRSELTWEIDDPHGKITVDFSLQPVTPTKHLTFNVTTTPTGGNFIPSES